MRKLKVAVSTRKIKQQTMFFERPWRSVIPAVCLNNGLKLISRSVKRKDEVEEIWLTKGKWFSRFRDEMRR